MSKFTSAKQVLVVFEKHWLTGLSAGTMSKAFVIANSRKSARETAKDLRETKTFSSEIGEELYTAKKVKVVPFTKGLLLSK